MQDIPASSSYRKVGSRVNTRSSMYIKALDHSTSYLSSPQPPQGYRPDHGFIRKSPSGMLSPYLEESVYEDDMRKISLIRSVDQLVINKTKVLQVSYGDLSIIKRESFLCHPVDPSIARYSLVLHRLSCIDRKTFDNKFYELDQISRNTNHPNILRIFSFWSEESPDAFSYKSLIVLQEYSQYTLREYISSYLAANKLDYIPETLLMRIGSDLSNAVSTLHQSNVSHCGLREYSIYVRVDESIFEATDLETPEPSMVTFCLGLPWRAELEVLCTPSYDSVGSAVKTPMSQMLSSTLVKKAPDTIYIKKETLLRNNPDKFYSNINRSGRNSANLSNVENETGSRGNSSLSEGYGVSLPTLSVLGSYNNLDLYSLGIALTKVIELYGPSDIKGLETPTEIDDNCKEYSELIRKYYPNLEASLALLLNVYEKSVDNEISINANQVHALFATYFAVKIQRNFRSSLVKRDRKLVIASATMIQCEYRKYLYSRRFRSYRKKVLCSTAHSLQAMIKALPNRLYFDTILKSTIKIQSTARMFLTKSNFLEQKHLSILVQKIFRGLHTRNIVSSWKQQLLARKKQMESLGRLISNTDIDTVNINPFHSGKSGENDTLYPASYSKYKTVGSYLKANPDKFDFMENADKNLKIIEELSAKNRKLEEENISMKKELESIYNKRKDKEEAIGVFAGEFKKIKNQLRTKYEKYNASCNHSSPLLIKVEPVSYTAWEKLHDTQNVVENVLRDDSSVFTRKDACIKTTFNPSIVTKIKVHPGEPGPLHLDLTIMDRNDKVVFSEAYKMGRNTTEINTSIVDACKASFVFKDNIRGGSICSIRFIEVIGIPMSDSF